MHLDANALKSAYPESQFANETKVCTTACSCSFKGTESCDEDNGVCKCKKNFAGSECDRCVSGFILNEKSHECDEELKCAEYGGSVDCSDHGTCIEDKVTGQAKCHCFEGFTNDGLELCSRCSDPMFEFPNCVTRSIILDQPDIDCEKMRTLTLSKLWTIEDEDSAMPI